MSKTRLQDVKARARELARSGTFFGWRAIEFELRFEEGFLKARDWLDKAATRQELDRICYRARAARVTG
jgi:hypothetical protein